MIKVRNLLKRYGMHVAVNRVGFEVGKGEIVGLLGPNGAGKTTVMNILTGYISCTEGTVLIDGHDIVEQPLACKRSIGYLPETPPLYPDLTVGEYLSFVFDLKRCTFQKEPHLKEVCAVTKLEGMERRLIRNLSKGYRQRVGLAQALVGNPPILILDEPTVGLDPKEIKEIRGLIQRLGATHTILLSSHILSEVQAICGRVLIINEGYLVRDQTTEQLLTETQATGRFAVRLAAPREAAVAAIRALDGVKTIEYVGTFEKGTIDLIIEADPEIDLRRALFDLCAKNDWYILMITPIGLSLEDVFIRLVSGPPAQEAKALEAQRRQLAGRQKEEEHGRDIQA